MTMIRAIAIWTLLVLSAASPRPAHTSARPDTLADSTVVAHWSLGNGLRVATRHIPGSGGVGISLALRVGSDDDPAERPGLSQLLAELAYLSAAGDIPERDRKDLDSQRPLGWSFVVTRRYTMFTEIATPAQFPGVLRETALRLRGVSVSRQGLRTALENTHIHLADQLVGPPGVALYHQSREAALAREDADILRRAGGGDLSRIDAATAQAELGRRYVPANAVLALAGNLRGVDVPKLVQSLFGDIPAGTPRPPTVSDTLRPVTRELRLAAATRKAGVVGILAPALADSSHPPFYLNAMMLSSVFTQAWSDPEAKVRPTLFHYAIFDEPDLLRLFPPAGETPEDLGSVVANTLETLYTTVITRESYDQLRGNLLWTLGGPMTPEQLRGSRTDSSVLHTLVRSLAGREITGGAAFWDAYRDRFSATAPGGLQTWLTHFRSPANQVRLLVAPLP